jgi:hypothetical protein
MATSEGPKHGVREDARDATSGLMSAGVTCLMGEELGKLRPSGMFACSVTSCFWSFLPLEAGPFGRASSFSS